MLAVTTHDTKRNADLRSRLDVLSEIPAEWAEHLDHWRTLNLPFKTPVRGGRRLPDPNTVQHLFQALLGIWPLSPLGVGDLGELRERLSAYALKAAREAKQHTSWTEPDAEFEDAIHADVSAILSPERAPRLLDDVERVARRIALPGLWNALSRTVLHLASPGVPDIYQGDELWSFALVDPDNRRPVDYDERMRKLEEVERGVEGDGASQAAFLQELVRNVADGRLKLHVIRAALAARRRRPEPFRSTAYEPLEAAGPEAGRVVAFARGNASARLIAAVPRLIATSLLEQDGDRLPTDPALWSTTTLALPLDAPRRWTCALSGESHAAGVDGRLRLDRLFGILPVALLLSDPSF
jgi:(1->4)-alpha-D-glucan 1-alpha-D-glucosylmutase